MVSALPLPRDQQLARRLEAAAWRYCALIDGHPGRAACGLLADVGPALAELYYRASALGPRPAALTVAAAVPDEIADLAWLRLFTSLHASLGSSAHYPRSRVGDDPDGEGLGEGCLADDLAGIYLAARRVTTDAVCSDGAISADTIACWHHSFGYHWGRHAVDAMGAIHALTFAGHRVHDEFDDCVETA
jgi:Domain of unknown function (DUF5063)